VNSERGRYRGTVRIRSVGCPDRVEILHPIRRIVGDLYALRRVRCVAGARIRPIVAGPLSADLAIACGHARLVRVLGAFEGRAAARRQRPNNGRRRNAGFHQSVSRRKAPRRLKGIGERLETGEHKIGPSKCRPALSLLRKRAPEVS
jgi:hypothetical protein